MLFLTKDESKPDFCLSKIEASYGKYNFEILLHHSFEVDNSMQASRNKCIEQATR